MAATKAAKKGGKRKPAAASGTKTLKGGGDGKPRMNKGRIGAIYVPKDLEPIWHRMRAQAVKENTSRSDLFLYLAGEYLKKQK